MNGAVTCRPWTATEVASAGRTPDQVHRSGDRLYWSESRPDEGGRVSLMQARPGETPVEILPAPFSARSRLLEYGGGAFAVGGGALWFVSDPGQDLYRLDLADGAVPQRIWTGGPDRFGDLYWDAAHARLLAVREAADGRLSLVAVDTGGLTELAAGADFYANPRVSVDGRALLFIAWDAPHMPWDAAALYRAILVGGRPCDVQRIAGGPGRSVCQAEFDARGDIVLLGETDGWWTPLRWHDGALHRLWPEPVDCGFPRWQAGMRQLALLDDGRIVWVATSRGQRQLMVFEPIAATVAALDLPWTEYAGLTAWGLQLACIAAAPDRRWEVIALSLDPARSTVCSDAPPLPAGVCVSSPQWLAFRSGEGEAYGHFYAPAPRRGDTGALPPLLVRGHGGPTSRATTALEPRTQFWTSRGFAVLDVDYRGSTGYGQAYRQALDGRWGEADVADCVAGADFLVATGAVDGARCVISGSSAGGLTVLGALAFHERFAAGGCYYGIGDLAALAQDTHKFEAHYLDSLVGPWPAAEAIYRARSPRFHAGRIRAPVIFFQGAEDRVVPPAQCREMARLLRENGIAADYHEFPGEGHGFRRAETVIACLEAEAAFYARVLSSKRTAPVR
ncbi:MAG TPA: prolyl oligopeptidase family serine peptidase [Candidatus Macondimonas sp.]|nr:prolyl oligopeptidase family serine peptidase [Candidatus Macondimonas sp.]